jgi:hypothetical protein
MDAEQLKGKIWIRFNNEEGVGAGQYCDVNLSL